MAWTVFISCSWTDVFWKGIVRRLKRHFVSSYLCVRRPPFFCDLQTYVHSQRSPSSSRIWLAVMLYISRNSCSLLSYASDNTGIRCYACVWQSCKYIHTYTCMCSLVCNPLRGCRPCCTCVVSFSNPSCHTLNPPPPIPRAVTHFSLTVEYKSLDMELVVIHFVASLEQDSQMERKSFCYSCC